MASPQLSSYQQALWLDADLMIDLDVPDPLPGVDPDKVSMVLEMGSFFSRQPEWFRTTWRSIESISMQTRWGVDVPQGWEGAYALWGVPSSQRPLFNTGVIAFSPARHRQVFLDIYTRWLDGGLGSLHEMIPLNLVLQQLNLCAELPEFYNRLVGVMFAVFQRQPHQMERWLGWSQRDTSLLTLIDGLRQTPAFLHFAGAHMLMRRYLSGQEQLCSESEVSF